MIDITEFPRTRDNDLDWVTYSQYLQVRESSLNPEKLDSVIRRKLQ